MTLHVEFKVTVGDLQAYVDQEFGSLQGLERHLSKHPRDAARVVIYEALRRNTGRPSKTVKLGQMILGRGRRTVSPAKLEVLECLIRSDGLSVRELARLLDKDPATISEHLRALGRDGLILKEDRGRGRAAVVRSVPHEMHIWLTRGRAGADA